MRPSPYKRPKRPVDPINRFLNWTMAALLLASSALLAIELMSLMQDGPGDQPTTPTGAAPITTINPSITCTPLDPESTARQPGYAAEDVCEVRIPDGMFSDDTFWNKLTPNPPPMPVPEPSNLRK